MKLKAIILSISLISFGQSSAKLPQPLSDCYDLIRVCYGLSNYIPPLLGLHLSVKDRSKRQPLSKYDEKDIVKKFIEEKLTDNSMPIQDIRINVSYYEGMSIDQNNLTIGHWDLKKLKKALMTLQAPSEKTTDAERDAAQKTVFVYSIIIDHEIGHYKHKDGSPLWRRGLLHLASFAAAHCATEIVLKKTNLLPRPSNIQGLLKNTLILHAFTKASWTLRASVHHFFSRKKERKADAYAFERQKNPAALIALAEHIEEENKENAELEKLCAESNKNNRNIFSSILRRIDTLCNAIIGDTHPSRAERAQKARQAAAKLIA